MTVAEHLHAGLHPPAVARTMGVSLSAVRYYMLRAINKIPGDFEGRFKIILWYRGGSLEHLGAPLPPNASRRNGTSATNGGTNGDAPHLPALAAWSRHRPTWPL